MFRKKRRRVHLTGKRIILRDLREEDIPALWFWHFECENPEWIKWYTPYKPIEESTKDEFIIQQKWELEQAYKQKIPKRLAIETDNKFIGFVKRYWVDKNSNWQNINICIYDPDYWSGGYGTEAFSLWISYLFEHMDIVRLGITTWSGNRRMINLAEKLNMKHEGVIRKAYYVDGVTYDAIYMGILKEEWDAHLRNTN